MKKKLRINNKEFVWMGALKLANKQYYIKFYLYSNQMMPSFISSSQASMIKFRLPTINEIHFKLHSASPPYSPCHSLSSQG